MVKKLTVIIGLALLAACGKPKPAAGPALDPNAFDTNRAGTNVAQQIAFGPRPSGGLALVKAAAFLKGELESYGLEVELQEFTAGTPRGPAQFRNIIARTQPQSTAPNSVIVVGSHYDTKSFDEFTFVGANDGASSSGVLLEIARVAAKQPNLVFVWFDGEEAMVDYGAEDGLWGSKYFVENLKGTGKIVSVKAMILLDMIGDANLNVTMPANSSAPVVQRVFDVARALGYRESFGITTAAILDDHDPFLRAGIPAVDIIDFQFGSAPGLNDYWHTDKDTLDKISPRSLEIVGKTTLRLISDLQGAGSLR